MHGDGGGGGALGGGLEVDLAERDFGPAREKKEMLSLDKIRVKKYCNSQYCINICW